LVGMVDHGLSVGIRFEGKQMRFDPYVTTRSRNER
jgi:hypothetical protein